MQKKRILRPDRLRKTPSQFSWLDHRLVREGYLHRCNSDALALYLFLVTVGDAQGLSYYADQSVEKILSMSSHTLAQSRKILTEVGLIAFEKPIYQILSLGRPVPAKVTRNSVSGAVPIKTILNQMMECEK